MKWRKSSYSGQSGGNCIEVADHDSRVLVRDTKDNQGPILQFTPDAWRRFAKQLKSLASQPAENSPRIGAVFVYRESSVVGQFELPFKRAGRSFSSA